MKSVTLIAALGLLLASALCAAEKPVTFVPAKPDPLVGDWKGSGGIVAQVSSAGDGNYQANLLKAFDAEDKPVAVLKGVRADDTVKFTGDGWSAAIKQSHLTGEKQGEHFDLQPCTRTSPTAGASPPAGAVVLFEGRNLDAWAKKAGKDWLKEDGPAPWKLVEVDGGTAVEVVPGADCIITHQKFGDCRVHVEFRTLGAPTNSGVFLQDRYEVNINETYGRLEGNANGGLDNCSQAKPRIRSALPPLAWQTLDIDFTAPRFEGGDGSGGGKKTAPARATVLLNGTKIYDNQPLDPPHGAASRLGEAPTGPLMLQEHGMPLQFRNIWLVESKPGKD